MTKQQMLRVLGDVYDYEDESCATANQIFAELDDKWDMVELAKAYAQANELAEPTVLGDFLTFARAFADEVELRGWVYRDLIHGEPELSEKGLRNTRSRKPMRGKMPPRFANM